MCSNYPVLSVSLLVAGVAFAARPTIAALPPVVRANPFVKQEPPCYIEMRSVPMQSLMEACWMGEASRKQYFDLQTDENKDGVPDELAAFFDRSRKSFQMSIKATPEERRAQAAKQRAFMQELAERLPVKRNTRSALQEMGDLMYELAATARSAAPSPQLRQQSRRMEQLVEQMQQDPAIQQFEQYSERYEENRRQQSRREAQKAS